MRLPERRAQLDLSLFAAEDGRGGIGLSLEFNADLFDGGTAERMLGHLRTLLEGAVAAPEIPVWHLPLLSEAERGQLFGAWNDTAREYPPGSRAFSCTSSWRRRPSGPPAPRRWSPGRRG